MNSAFPRVDALRATSFQRPTAMHDQAPEGSSNLLDGRRALPTALPASLSSPVGRLDVPSEHHDYAALADAASRPQETAIDVDGDGTTDWTRLSDQELEALGLDSGLLHPGWFSTFDAAVYTDGQGNYVLAFPGFQEGADGQQHEAQVGDAVALAGALQAALAGEPGFQGLTLVGHSLGGAMASAAAVFHDLPAVVFAPHSVSDETLECVGLDPDQARADAQGLVTGYAMDGDTVLNPTCFGRQFFVGHRDEDVMGQVTTLENDESGSDRAHDMATVMATLTEADTTA